MDECPGCGRAKDAQYGQCLDCYGSPPRQQVRAKANTNRWYKREYSPAWDAGDAAATQFFVYLLKLDGGTFYAGQTRELRERLSEHRDGRVNPPRAAIPSWSGSACYPREKLRARPR